MSEASDPEQAIDRHERTTEPGLNKVQRGWDIYDRLGRRLGKVVERDDASVVVEPGPEAEGGTRLPLKLIADEHPDGRWATLSVAAGDIDGITTGHDRGG